ncbi:unnamed protein product [Euphydryas editha]|uniref:Uncharacterized protein n=1 Tax=Euphydryas editha TaxID=104508 RepID=A0AAU9U3J4_EUPED|nr:unnamed protein product [Euphydryas editha]
MRMSQNTPQRHPAPLRSCLSPLEACTKPTGGDGGYTDLLCGGAGEENSYFLRRRSRVKLQSAYDLAGCNSSKKSIRSRLLGSEVYQGALCAVSTRRHHSSSGMLTLLRTKNVADYFSVAGFLCPHNLLFTELRRFDDFSLHTPDTMDTDIIGGKGKMRLVTALLKTRVELPDYILVRDSQELDI